MLGEFCVVVAIEQGLGISPFLAYGISCLALGIVDRC